MIHVLNWPKGPQWEVIFEVSDYLGKTTAIFLFSFFLGLNVGHYKGLTWQVHGTKLASLDQTCCAAVSSGTCSQKCRLLCTAAALAQCLSAALGWAFLGGPLLTPANRRRARGRLGNHISIVPFSTWPTPRSSSSSTPPSRSASLQEPVWTSFSNETTTMSVQTPLNPDWCAVPGWKWSRSSLWFDCEFRLGFLYSPA